MWGLAGLWHELPRAAFYARAAGAAHEGTGILFVAYLVLALLMAYLYSLGYRSGRPAMEGLRFGAVIGVLWVYPHELAMAGAHGGPLADVFQNAAWHVVEQGAGGIVIAPVHGRLRSAVSKA